MSCRLQATRGTCLPQDCFVRARAVVALGRLGHKGDSRTLAWEAWSEPSPTKWGFDGGM